VVVLAAEREIARFAREYGAKCPKAVASLTVDQDRLLAYFDYPAEHWKHLRTTNPIESTFATVRLREGVTTGGARGPPGSRWRSSCCKSPKGTGAASTALSSCRSCARA
jgi:hypothetical protein